MSSWSRIRPNSASTSADSELADSSALSSTATAIPLFSLINCQCFIFAPVKSSITASRCIAGLRTGFEQHRAAQAAADTDRCDATFGAVAAQHVQQMQDNASAGSADRMTDRHRAAIDIQPLVGNAAKNAWQAQLVAAILRVLQGL